MEKYNPERGRWSKLSGLSLPRRSPGVVAYRDRLYVVARIFLFIFTHFSYFIVIVGWNFLYVPIIVYFQKGGRYGGEGGLEQRRGVLHNKVANSEVANLSLFQVFCPSSNEWSKMAKPMTEVNGWCSACLGWFLLF